MTIMRTFFPKIRALFSKFRKRAGETSPPPLVTCLYSNNLKKYLTIVPSLNKFQQNILQYTVSLICCFFNLLILISNRGKSRAPKATKMGFSSSTTNDSQPLTVVIKNFVLYARSAWYTLNQTLNRLTVSPSQCSRQALYPLYFSSTK